MPDINYDESKVPSYTLPDPLKLDDGRTIQDVDEWESHQRQHLLKIFENQIYGQAPPLPASIASASQVVEESALDGLATRKQIVVQLLDRVPSPTITIALYLPAKISKPVHTFLGLNFGGNHAIEGDERLLLSQGWLAHNDPDQLDRGSKSSRWSLKRIIERGYGLATIYHGDISTDLRAGYDNNIFSYFYRDGQTQPHSYEWGAIGAWAWGLRRAIDYLNQHEPSINQIMLIGHSRLGKAALWAAAQDQRVALVISNNSGCMGAAISRRAFGETVEAINTTFSRWLCQDFHQYNRREAYIPIDQHTLIALIAPRPVYIASVENDLWADPYGEFLGGYHANPVYHLYGKQGLPVDQQPPIHQPVIGTMGYHIRSGDHDVTDYDWGQFLNFADHHLKI